MNYVYYVHFYMITFLIDTFRLVRCDGSTTLMNYSTQTKIKQKADSSLRACCNTSPRELLDVLENITLYDKYNAPTHDFGW